MTDPRLVLCDDCASEGRIYRGQYEDERDCGPCPACEGTGHTIIETEPVTLEDLEMSKRQEYRIFLEACPRGDFPLKAGYFGRTSQHVDMNRYIYCRTDDREAAYTFDADAAVHEIIKMHDKGYPARCDPPIHPSASPVLTAICGSSR